MVESLMIMTQKGNEYALQTLIDYFEPKIWLNDPTGLNDLKDLAQLKKIAVWKTIMAYTPEQGMGYLMQSCRWMALNSLPHRNHKNLPEIFPFLEGFDVYGEENINPKTMLIQRHFEKLVKKRNEKSNKFANNGRSNLLWDLYVYIRENGLSPQSELKKIFGMEKALMSKLFTILKELAVESKGTVEKTLWNNHIYLED